MHFYLLSRISTLFHHLWKVSLSYNVKFSDRFLSKGFPIYLNCDQLPRPWNKTQQLQHHVVGTMCSSQHIQCQTLTLYVLRWYIQCLTHTVSDTVCVRQMRPRHTVCVLVSSEQIIFFYICPHTFLYELWQIVNSWSFDAVLLSKHPHSESQISEVSLFFNLFSIHQLENRKLENYCLIIF